jgi:hypothetical protein
MQTPQAAESKGRQNEYFKRKKNLLSKIAKLLSQIKGN